MLRIFAIGDDKKQDAGQDGVDNQGIQSGSIQGGSDGNVYNADYKDVDDSKK